MRPGPRGELGQMGEHGVRTAVGKLIWGIANDISGVLNVLRRVEPTTDDDRAQRQRLELWYQRLRDTAADVEKSGIEEAKETERLRALVKRADDLLHALGHPDWQAEADRDREMLDKVDPGVREYVRVLRAGGIETFESCEGGPDHAYPVPTVRFHGGVGAGYAALAVALDYGLPVQELRRTGPVVDGVLTGPHWELTFREGT